MMENLPSTAHGHLRPTKLLTISLSLSRERMSKISMVVDQALRTRYLTYQDSIVPKHLEEYCFMCATAIARLGMNVQVPRWFKLPSFLVEEIAKFEMSGPGYRVVVGGDPPQLAELDKNHRPEWWFEFETAMLSMGIGMESHRYTESVSNFLKADIENIDGVDVVTGVEGLSEHDLLLRIIVDVLEKDKLELNQLVGYRSSAYDSLDDLIRNAYKTRVENLVAVKTQ